MLRSLEKKGYLIRRIDIKNRRCIVVELTEAGRAVLQEKSEEFSVRYEGITNGMQEREIKQIIKLIDRLHCAMACSAVAPGL